MKKIVYAHFPSGKWKKTLFLMRISIVALVCSIGTMVAAPSFSQHTKIDVSYKRESLSKVLNDLGQRTGSRIVFVDEEVAGKSEVTLTRKDATLEEILGEILPRNGLTYTFKGEVVVIVPVDTPRVQQPRVQSVRVTGRVTDEKGNPLIGVSVVINQTARGTVTDANGRYAIQARADDVLKFSYIGYREQTVPIDGKETLNVQLQPSAENIDEVVVVGFGEQKKESIVSAITSVKAESLRSSNSDLTSAFAGRIPGMIAWQTGGIPGTLTVEEMNTKFYVRGITSFGNGANINPLVLMDGVEVSILDLARVDPEDIESFSVLKDATATAMYGARGANGVIIVTTKKGVEGSVYTSFRYETIMSMPTREIDVVDPITYMKAYNEAQIGRDPLATPKYSADKINNTDNPNYPSWVYPSNDWYNILFKNMQTNHHMGLNIRGGGQIVQYYASLNYNFDQGMLKTDRLNDFDVNIRNNQMSMRINLNINLTNTAKLLVNSTNNLDKYRGPYADVRQAYSMAFKASPVDYAAVYPPDKAHSFPHILFGGVDKGSPSPYSAIQRGYTERSRFSTTNRLEYIQNLSSLVKGLELRANASLYQEGYYVLPYSTRPYMYSLSSYDHLTGFHTLEDMLADVSDSEKPRRTIELVTNSKVSTGSTQIAGEVWLLHNAAWGDHTTSVTGVFQIQQSSSSTPGSYLNAIPARNTGLSMRLSYGFKERYYLEGSFGYNGSERFTKKNRFGFFPAGGAAWVVSKERFMEGSRWLTYLKLRASYGKVGNDGIGTGASSSSGRFVYMTDMVINQQNQYQIRAYKNPDIKWEIAEQVNFGVDMAMWNGLLNLTVDAYQEKRHNILSQRLTVPATMGLGLYPYDNGGKVRSRGLDVEAKIQHAFSNDLWIILTGTMTYSKATIFELDEAVDKPAWQRRIGKDISQQIGYIAEGLFQTQQEIDAAPTQSGQVMPGDIRYRDVNGDGIIDINDAVNIGYPTTPRLIYGFQGTINYKNLEFNFAFQGSGQRTLFLGSPSISPFYNNNALLTAIWNDHWSPDNMQSNPLWPRLSTNNIVTHNMEEGLAGQEQTRFSTYFMREVKFLRCQSLELGYNLSSRVVKKLDLERVKFFVRTNNPFVISNFDLWDIELGSDGFNYPIQRTYSIGVNVSF